MNLEKHVGWVAVIGRPNVGKSTLINRLVENKVSITSRKPQTTRHRIIGIKNTDEAQIILIDTPGIHESPKRLSRAMTQRAWGAVEDADLLLLMVVAGRAPSLEERRLLESLKKFKEKPLFLIINKIDLVERSSILGEIDRYRKLYPFEAIIPVSALHNDGLDALLREITEALPRGPLHYSEEGWTDQTERFLAEEQIREQIFRCMGDEIPYQTAVQVESFKEKGNRTVVEASIWVEKDSQKGILIGRKGETLKKIGRESRKELEALLGRKVFLSLWVKVDPKWSQKDSALKRFGYL